MSWLNESMRSAKDFREKKENDGHTVAQDAGKSNIRAYRKEYDDYKAVNKAMNNKYGNDWQNKIERGKVDPDPKDSLSRSQMNYDANNAKNAVDRHNRRHPQAQVENCWLSETTNTCKDCCCNSPKEDLEEDDDLNVGAKYKKEEEINNHKRRPYAKLEYATIEMLGEIL